jgi:FkbM family methyltransferase
MKKHAIRFVDQVLDRAGYKLLPKWRLEYWPMARHLARLFTQYRVDCVIDVGAHEGGYGAFLRRDVGYRGPILSFEPTSRSFGRLNVRAEFDPSWTPFQLALGSEIKDMIIRVAESSDLTSFLEPCHNKVDDFIGANVTVAEETVSVTTLDAFMEGFRREHDVSRLYLKMDTQGFDLEVLRGATLTLADVVGLQSEMSVLPIYKGMPGHEEAMADITRRGYELSGMFPITTDRHHRLVEYDCVFVRSPRAETGSADDATVDR